MRYVDLDLTVNEIIFFCNFHACLSPSEKNAVTVSPIFQSVSISLMHKDKKKIGPWKYRITPNLPNYTYKYRFKHAKNLYFILFINWTGEDYFIMLFVALSCVILYLTLPNYTYCILYISISSVYWRAMISIVLHFYTRFHRKP